MTVETLTHDGVLATSEKKLGRPRAIWLAATVASAPPPTPRGIRSRADVETEIATLVGEIKTIQQHAEQEISGIERRRDAEVVVRSDRQRRLTSVLERYDEIAALVPVLLEEP
jgi:hypothetical protein